MTQSQSPLARREQQQSLVPATVTSIARREEVERFEATVTLPPSFMYVIPGRKKVDNQWVDDNKVGITSDGYDYANRTLGATFFLPGQVPDAEGNLVLNPIHKPDYIYMRMAAVWYNETGQLVAATEDLEVDYLMVWANARLESPGSELVVGADGRPELDDRGQPIVVIRDFQKMWDGKPSGQPQTAADQEKKAYKAYMQLRTMGMRYAQTVLRTRLLKIALGVKSLPLNQPREFALRVVGYRDKMDPITRIAAAQDSAAALFGSLRPADGSQRLSDDDLRSIERDDVDTSVDQAVGVATGVIEPEAVAEQPAEGKAQDEFGFGG
jgi:hypothetical protein